MKAKKIQFRLSALSLSVSVLAASAIGFFASPSAVQAQSVKRPAIATVKSMTNGDNMCYVNLVDAKGKVYQNVGADFKICAEKTYLNKKVRLSYKKQKVNDCQSAEPCGKSRLETLISRMQIVR